MAWYHYIAGFLPVVSRIRDPLMPSKSKKIIVNKTLERLSIPRTSVLNIVHKFLRTGNAISSIDVSRVDDIFLDEVGFAVIRISPYLGVAAARSRNISVFAAMNKHGMIFHSRNISVLVAMNKHGMIFYSI
ncbi:hypothetical protein A3Q56_05860 [Intoshia linei]|uniref:Uncharacterized protein n=1 Tax=Intoshia linei TaxID=1819745 RepID=A0A177AWL7_9BILA|nr:hypothetical protein A3Q56_05860 [Intoshia linei]